MTFNPTIKTTNNMECTVKTIRAYPRNVVGFKRHDRDLMISFCCEFAPEDVHDLFLTQEQAYQLLAELKESVIQNEILSKQS